jgi:hypothetical protein
MQISHSEHQLHGDKPYQSNLEAIHDFSALLRNLNLTHSQSSQGEFRGGE